MKKRLVAMALIGCMAFSLAACGSSSSSGSSSDSTGDTGSAASETASTGTVQNEEGEEVTLTFMNGSTDELYVEWLDQVVANFEAENPNIDVEIEKTSVDSYSQTVMTRFAAGDAPDLFSFAENDIDDMVPSGYVMDISDSANVSNYADGMLDDLSSDGKVYALPISIDFMCVTYNQDVFDEYGIEVPTTWSEFLDVCETLQENGVAPIAEGFADQWVINGISQTVYGQEVLGNDGPDLSEMVDRTYKFSEVPQWTSFLEKLQDMYGYMISDPFGTDQNTCYQMLASGEAAMIPNITSAVTNVMAISPDGNFGIFALPTSENAEDNVLAMNPPAAGIAISADTEHPDEALTFLEYLTSQESATLYAEIGVGIPVVQGVDTSALTGAFADAAEMMNNGEVKLVTSKSFPSENEDAFINAVSDFFLDGCKDIEGTLETLDTKFDNIAN